MSSTNLYIEVARTYLYRKMIWLAVVFYSLMMPAFIVNIGHEPSLGMMMMLFGLGYLTVAVVWHLREQVTIGHERLLSLRAEQMTIATLLIMTLAVVVPSIIAAMFGLSALGMASLLMLLVSLLAWLAYTQAWWLIVLILPAWFAMYLTEAGQNMLEALLAGEQNVIAATRLIAGIALWATLLWRLSALHEGHWEYHRKPNTGAAMYRMNAPLPQQRRAFERIKAINEPSPRLLTPPFDSLWSRVARRRYALGLGLSIWQIAFVIGLAAVGGMNPWLEFFLAGMIVMWLMIFPIMAAMTRFRIARSALASELLRPVSRYDCITEIGLAVACEQAMMWFVIAAACAVVNLCLHTDSVSWSIIAITGAAQVTIFGLLAWCSRYNNMGPIMFVIWMSVIFVMPASHFIRRNGISIYALLAVVVIPIVVGVLLTHAARQRWMQTDVT